MEYINYKTIPNCLRKYRRAMGFKQRDVAYILELKGTGAVSRWEHGLCLPSTINGFKLALLYRTMVDALFIDLMRRLRAEVRNREEGLLKIKKLNGC